MEKSIQRMIFHIPMRINRERASASSIRPVKMIEAFERLGYEVAVDLPGFKKDEIQLELNDGYLTISAEKGLDKEEKDKKDKYIRRERYAGSMSRTFYVGESVTENDIHAKYENGILTLDVPKEEAKKVPEKRYISIEG